MTVNIENVFSGEPAVPAELLAGPEERAQTIAAGNALIGAVMSGERFQNGVHTADLGNGATFETDDFAVTVTGGEAVTVKVDRFHHTSDGRHVVTHRYLVTSTDGSYDRTVSTQARLGEKLGPGSEPTLVERKKLTKKLNTGLMNNVITPLHDCRPLSGAA